MPPALDWRRGEPGGGRGRGTLRDGPAPSAGAPSPRSARETPLPAVTLKKKRGRRQTHCPPRPSPQPHRVAHRVPHRVRRLARPRAHRTSRAPAAGAPTLPFPPRRPIGPIKMLSIIRKPLAAAAAAFYADTSPHARERPASCIPDECAMAVTHSLLPHKHTHAQGHSHKLTRSHTSAPSHS